MARNLTAQEHAEEAARLLEESRSKGIASPARSVILAEAQVHATLALVGYAAPATLHLPEPVLAAAPFEPSAAPLIAAEDTTDDTPAPALKRRTRKAAAPKDEEAAK